MNSKNTDTSQLNRSQQSDWQPTSTVETLKKRAEFMRTIRRFFESRDVMEVETPLLSRSTVTDVHLDAFDSQFEHCSSGQSQTLFLQTSPEFAMKRLLCADSVPIFQICKAFRNESAGRLHNPEFTMLEWYRPGFNEHQLMDELEDLLKDLFENVKCQRLSYQQAFETMTGLNPISATVTELKQAILRHSPNDNWVENETNKDTLLQWMFSFLVEPNLGKLEQGKLGKNKADTSGSNEQASCHPEGNNWQPCFIYDFPASQAALAKVNKNNPDVAHRFELYFKGVELANGYFELQDEQEQHNRFQADNTAREELGKPIKPVDEALLSALKQGLPECSGVAVGIDRLFMLQQSLTHISQALAFDINRC